MTEMLNLSALLHLFINRSAEYLSSVKLWLDITVYTCGLQLHACHPAHEKVHPLLVKVQFEIIERCTTWHKSNLTFITSKLNLFNMTSSIIISISRTLFTNKWPPTGPNKKRAFLCKLLQCNHGNMSRQHHSQPPFFLSIFSSLVYLNLNRVKTVLRCAKT